MFDLPIVFNSNCFYFSSLFPAENRAELAKFGKNFLPILFNLFTTDPEKEQDPARLAVLDTVKVYLQIADAKVILY